MEMVVLMPSERQAIWSSRSASQARPIGRRRNLISDEIGDEGEGQDDVIEEDDALDRVVFQAEEAAEGEVPVGREQES